VRSSNRLWGFCLFRRRDALLFVDPEQQVIVEAVSAMYLSPPPGEVDFGALRQPQVHVAFTERHRAVLNLGMLGQQLYFRNRSDEIGFQPNNLIVLRGNPRVSLQRHRVRRAIQPELIRFERVWLALLLSKMNLPCKPAARSPRVSQ